MNRALKLLISAALLPGGLAISACHTMGPNEKAGADIDKAIGTDKANKDGPAENLGERLDKATDQNKDNLDSPKS